jgi:hypothetical protein
MVKCLAAFLDFCYIARRNSFTPAALLEMAEALKRFHTFRRVFVDHGVQEDDISLPRQHSLVHYVRSIWLFGAPNGLCSSITESRHITAVKEPWRRSNRFEALSQMLRTNTRMSKMSLARGHFARQGMMFGSTLEYTAFVNSGGIPVPGEQKADDDDEDGGVTDAPRQGSSIRLAATRGEYNSSCSLYTMLTLL